MASKKKLESQTEKSKTSLVIYSLALIGVLFVIYIILVMNYQKEDFENVIIFDCDEIDLNEYINISNSVLFLKLTTNCCGTEFRVYKNKENVIVEELVTGPLCRCICSKKILISPFKENYKLTIIKRDCKYYLEKLEKNYYELKELNKKC